MPSMLEHEVSDPLYSSSLSMPVQFVLYAGLVLNKLYQVYHYFVHLGIRKILLFVLLLAIV
jgi:hypothetical protein